jgi:hypothetical protein
MVSWFVLGIFPMYHVTFFLFFASTFLADFIYILA